MWERPRRRCLSIPTHTRHYTVVGNPLIHQAVPLSRHRSRITVTPSSCLPSALALYGTAAVCAAALRLAVPISRTVLPNAARSCAERSAPGCCFRPYHFFSHCMLVFWCLDVFIHHMYNVWWPWDAMGANYSPTYMSVSNFYTV